ncbi:MAG: hypothetical protein J3Q66DRAFT_356431 [Benniella sp.]|nr:MAG: hypothetical protein J3Q66DRAFT_356431 [Benniella sp.]
MERVVQWMQKRLSAQAQRLWAREASRAVFGTYQDSVSSPPTPNNPLSVKATTFVDLAALPTNLCISPHLRAIRILVDKPITTQAAITPTSKSARRFSSNKSEPPNNLTISIAPLTPSRAVGLEVVSIQESTGRARLFCRNSVIFESDKHRLVRSIDATITPPMSRDSPVGRRPPLTNVEDSSHWSRMVFSINMQHIRRTGSRTSIQEHLLTSIADTLDRFSKERYPSQVQDRILNLSPVLLHQSDCVVEHGRVRPTLPEDDISENFRLEISVATASLQATSPIQLQVKVVTQPVVQDAFGNTSMIRMGEAVLVEGLVLAREMAKVAGWTCLEDDDSQMVEWVRDQMDIQWDHAPVSQVATSIIPACSSVEGVQAYTRSRTPSGTNSRARTPSLSPYPSRTHSYRAKRQDDHGEKRDSTLAQLQEVSENLQAHESKTSANEDKLRIPTVAKVTVEGSSPTQRSGFRTSFGFSSLKDSRMQSLALDAETKDLLGVAPSKGSPLVGTSSPRECSRQDPVGLFDEGIGSLDFQSHGSSSLTGSPEPRKLSRFSIKSYQLELERSNHGLNDWGIGNLDMDFGKKTSTTTTVTNDLLSTPPLIADLGLPGTVSPLTPSPEQLPGTDFLHGLNISVGEEPPAHQVGRSLYSNELSHQEDRRENVSNTFLNSHTIDNGGRKKFGSFSIHNRHHNDDGNDSNNTASNENAQKMPSPLEPPAELIHDFLGESLAISPKPSNMSRFRSGSDSMNRSSLERASSDSGVGSSKAVHFADCESGSMMQRVHSEPNSHMMRRDSTGLLDSSLSGLAGVSSSASFKSKAHTRRSWGRGIGGSDISGIQGLSE